jgi:RHS repeat-associated protein
MNRVKVAEHAHYPFGAEIDVAPHENPEEAMKFTGHERDIVAGDGHTLDYMHARFYSPTAGRFLSVDPGRYEPERPQSWNRYAYVSNNPITYNDPTGREQPFNTASYDWSGFLKGVDSVVSAVTQDYRDAKEAIAGMGTSASLSENVMGAAVLGIITANTAVGAIEPEERGGVQILKNVAQGKAAEVAVGTELKAEGKVILGSQVSAKTSEGRRVIDHLVQNGSGVSAVEVKSGNATRNAAQVAKDGAMAKDGATLVGKNAPAQLKGQTIKIETEVRRPNE